MKARTLLYNGRIYTMADGRIFDTLVLNRGEVVAVGNGLKGTADFKGYANFDLGGKMVVPGLVDAHAHLFNFALSLARVHLADATSVQAYLDRISRHARSLGPRDWIVGEGYSPDALRRRVEPDRYLLDNVSHGRPAFIFSKDNHSCWVNSKALEIAGIDAATPDPSDGEIVRFPNGTPTGILREKIGYEHVFSFVPPLKKTEMRKRYQEALAFCYQRGVTGVHSFDSPNAFAFYLDLAERNKVGLRINHFPRVALLPDLLKTKTYYGTGTPYFRLAGIKLFADGALGSQTALCFQRYPGTSNYGIATTTVDEMRSTARQAAKLGFPLAVHAIGDRAVANVLDALEDAPALAFGARHRIEHVQLIRRRDIARLKSLGAVASMQPSHCPSDIPLINRYWASRAQNAFLFKTFAQAHIPMAFGSDAPIEPLAPLEGIVAAVRRSRVGKRDHFFPEQRLTAYEALHGFTAGAAYAVGQEHRHGYLLPGYPADLTILSDDITELPVSRLEDARVVGTILNGKPVWLDSSVKL